MARNYTRDEIIILGQFGKRTRVLFDMIDFVPTSGQDAILLCAAPEILVAGGFQAGKSVLGGATWVKHFPADLLRAVALEKAGRIKWPMPYWLIGNDYAATTKEFEYIRDHLSSLHLLGKSSKRVDPGFIEVLGRAGTTEPLAIIRTISAGDIRNIRMEAPFGIILCEASELTLEAFQRVRERIIPLGAWLFLSGTFEEDAWGWYAQLHREWTTGVGGRQSFSLATDTNSALFPEGENDPYILRFKEENSEEAYLQRIKGIPCAPRGIVFPEFREGLHVAPLEFDPAVPVSLWEDPGYGADSAHSILAVQMSDNQVRIIDELYTQGQTTEEMIDDDVTQRPWWGSVTTLVSDKHYASQHHAASSIEEVWRKKTGLINKGKREQLAPRIERIRSFLRPVTETGAPKLVIAPHCHGILSEFGCRPNPFTHRYQSYRWSLDENGDTRGSKPRDKHNHSIEALGRGLVYEFGYVGAKRVKTTGKVQKFGKEEGNVRRQGKRRAYVEEII